MSNFVITPNMSLIAPNPAGTANPETGPQYALDQNQTFLIIDGHTHGPGSGVQITPSGLNISTNLDFQNNSPYNVYSVVFSAPASNANLVNLYTNTQSGGGIVDLFYNDGAGNVIALTKAGAVNATIASIPGESYAGGTFTWVQGNGSTTPANFDIGSITIRPNVAATTNGVVLGPPTAIASQYNVQLPIVPGATSIMQLNPSGDMLATLVPDNSTIEISSQNLQVKDDGITTSKILDGSVTRPKLAAVGQQISASCGTFIQAQSIGFTPITNLSITITTTGRPVMLVVQSSGLGAYYGADASPQNVDFGFYRDSTLVGAYVANLRAAVTDALHPANFSLLDTPTAGTYTYTFQIFVQINNGTVTVNECVLAAYEL